MRRHRGRRIGALRLIVYDMTISTSVYDNSITHGHAGRGSAARPRAVSHNPENRLQRSVEPIAGGPEFVALNLETVTGGRTHNLSRERHVALHSNTPRRTMHVYVHDHITSRKSPDHDVTNLSHRRARTFWLRARACSIYLRARARANVRASAHCAHICVNSRSGDTHPEKASLA